MRLDQLTFTRFIASISIVVFHYGLNVFPFDSQFCESIFKHANIGVSYFFILSGYVMIIAYENKGIISWQDYYINRIARIYPVYILAIILLLVYKLIIQAPIDYKGLFLNILAVQAWVCGDALSFNSPGWSLSVEFFFYLLFPILFNKFYTRKSLKTTVFICLFIWGMTQIVLNLGVNSKFYTPLPSISHDFFYYFPLMHLNEFLIGNLAGILYVTKLNGRSKKNDWLILAILVALLFLLKYSIGLNFHNGLLALIFVPLILSISMNNGLFSSVSKFKLFVFLGEISYSIYILQFPVFFYAAELFKYLHMDNLLIRFYLSLIILILASSFSYKFIETPLRVYIKSLKFRKIASIDN